MPTNDAHQAPPQLEVAEFGPPWIEPPLTHPGAQGAEQPPPRGLADETHPSEDGLPMAWDQFQCRAMVDCEYPLRHHFVQRMDVLVAIDLRVYYSEGPPPKDVVPNLFVAVGVPSYVREIYRIAEEGKAPDWVLEVASKPTYRRNVGEKKDLYEALGVGEYFVYDPQGGMHDPRLQGWVLRGGRYKELVDLQRPRAHRALRSKVLGLELWFDGGALRLWDPSKWHYLWTIDEVTECADALRARREELARADNERARFNREKARADEAEAQLEVEVRARRALEARIAALESKFKDN